MSPSAKRWDTVEPLGLLGWYSIVWALGTALLLLEWLNDIGTTWNRLLLFAAMTLPAVAGAVALCCARAGVKRRPHPYPDLWTTATQGASGRTSRCRLRA
jgi:hypothetical protein